MLGRSGRDRNRIDAFLGDPRDPELVASLRFQRDLVEDLKEEADGLIPAITVPNPQTGRPMTRHQLLDWHTRWLWVLEEQEQLRTKKETYGL